MTRVLESSPVKKKPFIVREIPAPMLRRNVELSRNARFLWATMLSLADARTGELRKGEHWFDGAYIEREAQMCDRLRKKHMRELMAAGYVTTSRIRIVRFIRGRKREVLGEVHYTVHREQQHRDSSTVTFRNRSRKSPTNLPEIHRSGDRNGFQALKHEGSGERTKNHQDDSFFCEQLISKAESILREQRPHWAPWQAEAAVWTVAVNAHNSDKVPRSAQYFLTGVQNLSNLELDVIENWSEQSFHDWLTHTKASLKKWNADNRVAADAESADLEISGARNARI